MAALSAGAFRGREEGSRIGVPVAAAHFWRFRVGRRRPGQHRDFETATRAALSATLSRSSTVGPRRFAAFGQEHADHLDGIR